MSKNIHQVYVANPITSNTSTDLMYFGQSPYGVGNDAAMTYANFSAQFGAPYTAAALTRTDDTNVTLTLGGTPSTALLHATSITVGWSGTLSGTRGGTGVNNGSSTATYAGNLNFAASFSTSGAFAVTQTYTGITNVTFPTSGTLATTSQIPTGAALTRVDDTNVTLTLGGSPTTALINAASITAGWTGTLSGTRGGTGVNNGANTITLGGSISTANSFTTSGNFDVTQTYTGSTNVTFPTSGTLATTAQIPTGAALTKADDTNVTLTLGGSPTTALVNAASITAGWTGTLSGTRGGTGVNNGSSTITIGGNVTYSGAFTFTGTVTGNTTVTFPTSGTLATTSQTITANNVTGTSATLAVQNRYVANNAGLVTLTLPTTAAVGDVIQIRGGGAGGWLIAQNASQIIHLGSSASTTGVGGSAASSNRYDCLDLTCIVANNEFVCSGVQGNITIV